MTGTSTAQALILKAIECLSPGKRVNRRLCLEALTIALDAAATAQECSRRLKIENAALIQNNNQLAWLAVHQTNLANDNFREYRG